MNHRTEILATSTLAILLLACPPHARAEEGAEQPLHVPLRDASREAAVNNPVAREARLQWLVSQSRERVAWGDFEPSLVSSYAQSGLHRRNTAVDYTSQLGRQEYSEQKAQYAVGMEGKFLTGADYRLGYSLTRTESDLITTGSEYESFLGVSLTQPLLKGAFQQAQVAAIRLARIDTLIAFHTYRRQLIAVVSGAEAAYWDLVLAQELVSVAAQSVQMATDLLEDSRQRLALGKLSELDVAEADTQLGLRQAEMEGRRLDLVEAGARLRLLVAGQAGLATAPISADDPLAPGELDVHQFLSETASLRDRRSLLQPDIVIRHMNMEKAAIQLSYQRDQRLPQLDARATYGFQGLGNTPNTSLDRLQSQGYPSWTVSLELHLPVLGDLKGQGSVEEAVLGKQLAAEQLQAAERETEMTLDALAQRVLTYGKNAENARAVSGFRRQLLDVEMQRFQAGKSDIRRIYDLEQALADARQRELESYNKLRKSTIDLTAMSGTTLLQRGLETLKDGRITLSTPLVENK